MGRRYARAHVPLSSLYVNDYAGYLADQAIFTGRRRAGTEAAISNPWAYLTAGDKAHFRFEITRALQDGKITQREADNLIVELSGGEYTHRKPYRRMHFKRKAK